MKKKVNLIIILFLALTFNINVNAATVEENIDNLITRLNTLEKNSFLNSHPIGSIYITTSSDENTPSKMATKYGGTWVVYGENRTLRGTTGTVASTGGASTVTLTSSHMPSHTHSIPALSGTAASAGAHTHTVTAKGSVSSTFTGTSATTSTKSLTGYIYMHNVYYTGIHDVGGIISSAWTNSDKYFTPAAVGANGGAPSIGQMKIDASHNHTVTATGTVKSTFTGTAATTSSDSHTHTLTSAGSVSSTFTGSSATSSSSGAHTHTVSTTASTSGATGSATAFSILDPYITVYMYKRTA